MTIIGGELIRQPVAPVRPVLIPFPATLETERAVPSVTSDVGIQKRSDSERRARFPAGRLWESAGRVKDTERQNSATAAGEEQRRKPRRRTLRKRPHRRGGRLLAGVILLGRLLISTEQSDIMT